MEKMILHIKSMDLTCSLRSACPFSFLEVGRDLAILKCSSIDCKHFSPFLKVSNPDLELEDRQGHVSGVVGVTLEDR